MFFGGYQSLQTHLHADYGVVTPTYWALQPKAPFIVGVRVSSKSRVEDTCRDLHLAIWATCWTIQLPCTNCRNCCQKAPSRTVAQTQTISRALKASSMRSLPEEFVARNSFPGYDTPQKLRSWSRQLRCWFPEPVCIEYSFYGLPVHRTFQPLISASRPLFPHPLSFLFLSERPSEVEWKRWRLNRSA